MSSDRLILNTLQSMDEHQQLNIMDENFLNANTTSTSTNTDMNSQINNIHLEQNISDQNFANSSKRIMKISQLLWGNLNQTFQQNLIYWTCLPGLNNRMSFNNIKICSFGLWKFPLTHVE